MLSAATMMRRCFHKRCCARMFAPAVGVGLRLGDGLLASIAAAAARTLPYGVRRLMCGGARVGYVRV